MSDRRSTCDGAPDKETLELPALYRQHGIVEDSNWTNHPIENSAPEAK